MLLSRLLIELWIVLMLTKLFFKWGNPGLFFVYFRSFLITISLPIEKSVDYVLGIRTQGRRIVGTDKTMELWRPPNVN